MKELREISTPFLRGEQKYNCISNKNIVELNYIIHLEIQTIRNDNEGNKKDLVIRSLKDAARCGQSISE